MSVFGHAQVLFIYSKPIQTQKQLIYALSNNSIDNSSKCVKIDQNKLYLFLSENKAKRNSFWYVSKLREQLK